MKLVRRGTRFINQELILAFLERTLESINGKRKQLAYKEMVQTFLETVEVEEEGGEETLDVGNPANYVNALAEYINSLPPLNSKEYNSQRLVRICKSGLHKDRRTILEELSLYLREIFPIKERRHMPERECHSQQEASTSRRICPHSRSMAERQKKILENDPV